MESLASAQALSPSVWRLLRLYQNQAGIEEVWLLDNGQAWSVTGVSLPPHIEQCLSTHGAYLDSSVPQHAYRQDRIAPTSAMLVSYGQATLIENNPFLPDVIALLAEQLQVISPSHFAQEQQARYHAIFNSAVDGILTIDERGIVDSVNPATTRLFGYSAEEILGQNVSMLMPAPYAHEHDGYLADYHRTGKAKIIGIGREVEGKRKDGSVFPLELAVSQMIVGNKKMFTGIVRDITERKHIERMKNEFVSTVSHELRTPLTSIRGALSLVLGKASNELSDKTRQLLQTANRNSERLTLLINDILDLEKIESGALDFNLQVHDLVLLAKQAIASNESYAAQHQVQLLLSRMPEQALVRVDENRLLQVFANLLSNAIKYSPAHSVVDVSIQAQEQEWRVSIRDQGSGIPEHFRSRIFQRFSQADSSSRRVQGGTGLGLSITKAIVERLDGHIDYQTLEGQGTQFFFDLPMWYEMREHVPTAEVLPAALICEDNPDVANVLAELLMQEQFCCDIAATGAAAKAMLARKSYQTLLLDLTLPDIDGLVLLRELRADPAHQHLPIIVVSGRAAEGSSGWQGNGVAVVDWLQKPVDRDRLARALQQVRWQVARPRILHVEDEPDIVQVTQILVEEIADYFYARSLEEAKHFLLGQSFDLVLMDLNLPDGSGLELLDVIDRNTPVLVFSGQEADRQLSAQVHAALTKSKTSNEQLLAAIRQFVR